MDKSDRRVRRMFASIAGRYDLLNHLLSLNIDRAWRTFTTRTVPPEPGVPVLDCCTGTADLALAYDRAGGGRSPIVGADFCREMLEIGRSKVQKAGACGTGHPARRRRPAPAGARRHLRRGQRGVRPAERQRHGARHRRADPRGAARGQGGDPRILAARAAGSWAGIYLAFFRHVLPRIGQALAPNADGAYDYLPRSVLEFPDGQAMLDLLAARGLVSLELHPLTGGIATLYVGTKPAAIGATGPGRMLL